MRFRDYLNEREAWKDSDLATSPNIPISMVKAKNNLMENINFSSQEQEMRYFPEKFLTVHQKQEISLKFNRWKPREEIKYMKIEEKLDIYLNEARKRKITQPIRNKINKEIDKVVKQTYFEKIPLKTLFNVLEKYGIVPVQEDNTYWSGMLAGGVDKTEQVYFDLAWADSKEGNIFTEMIPNAKLALSYYKMPKSGRYEIISHLT